MSLDLVLKHSVVKESEGTRSDQSQKLATEYSEEVRGSRVGGGKHRHRFQES